MQLGMVGLGRMGGNMTERCMRSGHEMYDENDCEGNRETEQDCLFHASVNDQAR